MKKKREYAFHRVCPVCRFHKTFSGACCPDCTKLGYKEQRDGKIRRTTVTKRGKYE